MGYTKTVIKGVSWMSGLRMTTRVLTIVKTSVLARLLSPQEFGVFGIASIVLMFFEILTETGINVFLIQSKKNVDEYINSAWVVSIIRGIIISFSIFILSPLIASFFNTPDAEGILTLISMVPLIKGFINPSSVKFQKTLKFESEFWFRGFVFFFDVIATILFALLTHSVYSFVLGLIAGALLEVFISFAIFKPTPRFSMRKNYLSEIFHKGKWVTSYGVMHYFAENGDNIIVGRLLGSYPLGLYQTAYKISLLPISEVVDVVSKVIFPVYTKIADDKSRLFRAFIKTNLLTLCVSFLVGAIVFVFSREIVLVVLGSKWLDAVPVLRILAVYGILRTIAGPSSALFLSLGKQKYVALMIFARFSGLAITIYPLVAMFGLLGAGYSAIISVIVEIPAVLVLNYFIFRKKS